MRHPLETRRKLLVRTLRARMARWIRAGRSALDLPEAMIVALDDRDPGFFLFELFRAMVDAHHIEPRVAWSRVRAAIGQPSGRVDLEAWAEPEAPLWRGRFPEHMALIDQLEDSV